jgi:diguanylate cyclase (GGDEF)-like protein
MSEAADTPVDNPEIAELRRRLALAQAEIERLSTSDALTGLLNHGAFDERAQAALADAFAAGRPCALLNIGLDRYGLLHGTHGHRVADGVIAALAVRVRGRFAPPHLVGRRGASAFQVLLSMAQFGSEEDLLDSVRALLREFARPVEIDGVDVPVSASIGIAIFPRDGGELHALLDAAEAARQHARGQGDGACGMYTRELARRTELRMLLERKLRRAVETRDFRLHYQPLFSFSDGRICGAEVLLRWKDAELGDISPAEFIPIAEESGVIVELGDWVLREACRQRGIWRELGLELPPLAVNVSSVELRQAGCVERILGSIVLAGIDPGEIEVEVTETGLLDSAGGPRENLARLHEAGIQVALDDFGVGYSSLSHLRDLPIQRLKVDRSFTAECMRDRRTLVIVRAVVAMARELGLSVTAEGIETEEQATQMRALGCTAAQGWLYARAMPAEEFLRFFIAARDANRGASSGPAARQ